MRLQTRERVLVEAITEFKRSGMDSQPVNKEVVSMDWVWEILRYVAAWGGTGLIIWFWYWMFSNIGTF
jgi:hypothetical protein